MLLLQRLPVIALFAGATFLLPSVLARPIPQEPSVPATNPALTPDNGNASPDRVLPIVNLPLATQITASDTGDAKPGAVISSAFAYANDSNFYPGVRVPPGWSFSIGLLHPFVYPEGTNGNRPIYHSACLEDGSALPQWLGFDSDTVTFNGYSPATSDESETRLFHIKIMASDIDGHSDVEQGFNLTVGLHSLELRGSVPQLNVTAGYPTAVSASVWPQIQLDGQPISPENTTDLQINDSRIDWIRFDRATRDIVATPDSDLAGQAMDIPVELQDAFGGRLQTAMRVQVEAYAFTSNEAFPTVLGGRTFVQTADGGPTGDLDLSEYLAASDLSELSFEVSSDHEPVDQSIQVEVADGTLRLKGGFPEARDYDIVALEIRATNITSHAISILSLQLDLTHSDQPDEDVSGSSTLSSGAQAALGAAVGIACLAIVFFIIYLLNKRRGGGDLSFCSSLSMRHSASLGPETGMFTTGQRGEPYLTVDLSRCEDKLDNSDAYSAKTLVESFEGEIAPQRLLPSSSSLVVRMSKSASSFSRRIAQAVSSSGRFNKKPLSKERISNPIAQANPSSGTEGISSHLRRPPSVPNLPVLSREGLFAAVQGIGKRGTTDSTSTVFTNFSHDTELWGKSDHEGESNFSQTPSHRRPRCLTSTPRSGHVQFSPSSPDSAGRQGEVSSDESPTPRALYPRDRVLNTISEDLSREGGAFLSPFRNPFQNTGSETSSLGTIQTAARAVFEAATPEQMIIGTVRKTTHGSTTLKADGDAAEERSWIGSVGLDEGSDRSSQLGDKGSILNQTSFEGFKARDSVTADAEEIENATDGELFGRIHTSIAAETRSAQQLIGTGLDGRRMTSSRRTGSCSGLPPPSCS
jgi:hypothetical protein